MCFCEWPQEIALYSRPTRYRWVHSPPSLTHFNLGWICLFFSSLRQRCTFNRQCVVFWIASYSWVRSRSHLKQTKPEFAWKRTETPVFKWTRVWCLVRIYGVRTVSLIMNAQRRIHKCILWFIYKLLSSHKYIFQYTHKWISACINLK